VITRDDVLAAHSRIRAHIRRTPTVQVAAPSTPLWIKCEFMQYTGCFKARGALNRVMAAQELGELDPQVGIVAASGGNAGLANAYAAARVGVPATVFVPETAPPVKVARILAYGAEVRRVGTEYAEAYTAAIDFAEQSGAVFCHAYDQIEVAAGAGTLVDETIDDEPSIETVIVAVGGGGLLAGVLAGLDGRAQVVAVEPTAAPTLNAALRAGTPVDVSVSGIAADSLGASRVGKIAFDVARRFGVESVLVDDSAIISAREQLWNEYRIVAEHGAAAAYAALSSGVYAPSRDERVAVLISGANTAPATLATGGSRSGRAGNLGVSVPPSLGTNASGASGGIHVSSADQNHHCVEPGLSRSRNAGRKTATRPSTSIGSDNARNVACSPAASASGPAMISPSGPAA